MYDASVLNGIAVLAVYVFGFIVILGVCDFLVMRIKPLQRWIDGLVGLRKETESHD